MIDDTMGPRRLFFFFFFFQQQLSVHLRSRDFASHPPTIPPFSPISLSSRRATRREEARSFRRTRNGTVADATSYLEVSPGRSHSSRAAAKKPNDRAEIDWHVCGDVVRSRCEQLLDR